MGDMLVSSFDSANSSVPSPHAADPQIFAWQVEYGSDGDRHQLAQVALAPPGTCTPGQHAQLQAAVDQVCKAPNRRCTTKDSPADIDKKIDLNAQCIAARSRINNACFRGGDPVHQAVVDQELRALQNCHDVKAKVEAKAAQQSKDNSSVAWTVGGALVGGSALYWILSEGSRVFPPRNLIPWP